AGRGALVGGHLPPHDEDEEREKDVQADGDAEHPPEWQRPAEGITHDGTRQRGQRKNQPCEDFIIRRGATQSSLGLLWQQLCRVCLPPLACAGKKGGFTTGERGALAP